MERPDTARIREKERQGLERAMVLGSLVLLFLSTGNGMLLAIS